MYEVKMILMNKIAMLETDLVIQHFMSVKVEEESIIELQIYSEKILSEELERRVT